MTEDLETFTKHHNHQNFEQAIEELNKNNILFEGQFSFLNDATMRQNRIHKIEKALQYLGFDKKLTCLAFEIKERGFLHCLFFMGYHFNTIEDVKTAHRKYFINQ